MFLTLAFLILIFFASEYKIANAQATEESKCVCVPQHLCDDNDAVVNGQGMLDIRFPGHSCENYFEVCCENPIKQPEVEDNELKQKEQVQFACGQTTAMGSRITSDSQDTEFAELPWAIVVLQKIIEGSEKIMYKCGGSLIHQQVVLTAAHCVFGLEAHQIVIRAGEWNTRSQEEPLPHQDRFVQEIQMHPLLHQKSLKNDLALLFLSEPVTLTDNVNVICLPSVGLNMDNVRCIASGWGKNTFKKGTHSSTLKKVDIPIVPRDNCLNALRKTRLGPFYSLHKSFICAGGERNKDTCKGDGGSPLVCPIPGEPGRYVQMGIVSWGIGCGDENTPGVYVNMGIYRNWIDKQLEARNLETSIYKYE